MSEDSLAQQTRQTLENFVTGLPDTQKEVVGKAFEELLGSDVTDQAIKTGDLAPDFSLPSVHGGERELSAALAKGPVVLSFYRGSWCPFCNLELNALQGRLPEIRSAGASLIAVSPEKPDSSLTHAEKLQLEFDVLSDEGNATARAYGLVMEVASQLRPLYLEWGIDVPAANGDLSYQLPVPATYVIGSDGRVRACHVEKDYTQRMEPQAIIEALAQF